MSPAAHPNGVTGRHPFGGIAPSEWDRWPPRPGRFWASRIRTMLKSHTFAPAGPDT